MDTTPETTETKPTTIKTVSVKVSRQVDLGFIPYIKYVEGLKGKAIPFGTRDQSRAEFDVFVSAEVGTNDTMDSVIKFLSDEAHRLSEEILHTNYPKAFARAVELQVPEEAFVISKTTVERAAVGEF